MRLSTGEERYPTSRKGLKQVVNSNYRIEQLESAVKFSNSAWNKMDLADAYVAIGRNGEAV